MFGYGKLKALSLSLSLIYVCILFDMICSGCIKAEEVKDSEKN